MFKFPEYKLAANYLVQIAEEKKDSSFLNSIIISKHSRSNAILIDGLRFGKSYKWRYVALNIKGKAIYKSNFFTFETKTTKYIDDNFYRYKINKQQVVDGLIFLDNSKVAINRSGMPVWFMPNQETNADIKMTKSGTITLLSKSNYGFEGIEINLKGDTLWKTPINNVDSGDTIEHFHHGFCKLDNSNFMIMGTKNKKPKLNVKADVIAIGILIEYDQNQKVVWSWDVEKNKAFDDTDLYYPPNICSNFFFKDDGRIIYDPLHDNGFFYDEQNDVIFYSLRNQSRIIKIQKNTGNVITAYGDNFPSGKVKYANGFFKYQHAPILLPDNNLLVYSNNNIENPEAENYNVSKAVIFSQPERKNQKAKIVWEMPCNIDTLTKGHSFRVGNVVPLKNGNFLINTGGPEARIFEVTRKKQIVWDCNPEVYTDSTKKWDPSVNYKVSYSKSLYPVYFTISNSLNPDTINYRRNLKYNFGINNLGSEPDEYDIKYFIDNKLFKTVHTKKILPNKSKMIRMKFKKEIIGHQKIQISINSTANPKFKRKFWVYIN